MAEIRRLVLSAAELRALHPNWTDAMIEDYLSILEESLSVLEEIAAADDRIEANELAIAKLEQIGGMFLAFAGQQNGINSQQQIFNTQTAVNLKKLEQLIYIV